MELEITAVNLSSSAEQMNKLLQAMVVCDKKGVVFIEREREFACAFLRGY